jgi:uroporphyrin-III C-methyltransferase
LHWPTLAAAAAQGLTLVIYMGVAHAEDLQRGLLGGLPPRTPVAVVRNASLATQAAWHCTLGELATTVRREAIASPAIMIIGEVLHAMNHLAQHHEQSRVA